MWICRSRDNTGSGWGQRPRNNVARIERAEVVFRQHRASVFRKLEVKINKLVDGAALQQPEKFGQGKRRRDGAHEGRANCLSGEQCYPAAIQLAFTQHTLVCTAVVDLFVSG